MSSPPPECGKDHTFLTHLMQVVISVKNDPKFPGFDPEDWLAKVDYIIEKVNSSPLPFFPNQMSFSSYLKSLPERDDKNVSIDLQKLRKAKPDPRFMHGAIARAGYEEDGSISQQLSIMLLIRAEYWAKQPASKTNFQLVLQDLNLIKIEYIGRENQHVYWYLKTLCHIKLKNVDEAQVALNHAQDTLEEHGLDDKTLQKRQAKLDKGQERIKVLKEEASEPSPKTEQEPMIQHFNPKFPALSSAADVTKYPGELEHGLTATEDIHAGQILGVESPAIVTPYYHNINIVMTHCDNCFTRNYHLLPCPHCADVLFCTTKCRDEALSGYHKYTCKIRLAKILHDAQNEQVTYVIGTLLRMFTNVPYTHHLEERAVPEMASFDEEHPHLSDDQSLLWNLKNHDLKEYGVELLSLVAIAFNLIKSSGYLDEVPKDSIQEKESKMVKQLFTAFSILSTNFFTVKETSPIIEENMEVQREHIAMGGFNTMSLLNHSCASNCLWFFVEDKFILVARRFIDKGEELTLCYGLHIRQDLKERQKSLAMTHKFRCQCLGCARGWSQENANSIKKYVSSEHKKLFNEDKVTKLEEDKDLEGLIKFRRDESHFLHKTLSSDDYKRYTAQYSDNLVIDIIFKYCNIQMA